MKSNLSHLKYPRSVQFVLFAGTIIAMVIASAFFGLTIKQDEMIRNYIEIAAHNYFDSILITRRWNAEYGGVYVLKKEGMASNPYLENPDITTSEGFIYTMKNPALMTREISDMAKKKSGYQYHITSLKLLNPDNGPDEWEKEALLGFEAGRAETVQITDLSGKKVFRLMRPLFFETVCLDCHGQQGYRVGDVRGGISVTLPYDEIADGLKRNRAQMFALAALILCCFVIVFYFGVWRLLSRLATANSLLAEDREKLGQLSMELDRKVEERTGELSAVNKQLQKEMAERVDAENKIHQLNTELEQRINIRTEELEKQNQKLEKFNQLFVNREFRIKELRDQVAHLQREQKTKT